MAIGSFSVETREEVLGAIEELSEREGWGGYLLERAIEQLGKLERSEIALNREISDLRKETSELAISMNHLEPIEIALRLDKLQQEVFSLSIPSTAFLREDLSDLKDRLEQLHFQFTFPQTEELKLDSFQNNLRFRLEQKIAKADPKTAAVLKKTLGSLLKQCQAAEEVFRGKGLRIYSSLPPSVRADIEGRLFEKFPGCPIKSHFLDPIVISAAIMASLSDRMMDIEL